MRKFLNCSLLVIGVCVVCCNFANADETKPAEQNNVIVQNEEIYEAPNYDKVVPIPGWTRQSGDSATTIKEWKRWWSYLNRKTPFIMDWINNLKLRIYPGNEVFRSLFVRGIYDPNLVVVLNALLPRDGVLIDVGSNMGYCSLLASTVVGEDGKVFAIEPSERDFVRLLDNVNINGLKNVSTYRLIISDKEGEETISIASEERSALNTTGVEFSYKGIEKLRAETVRATTIDRFIESENVGKIDVLKLDIEGSESRALKGARNAIEKFRPAIILGLNETSLQANNSSIDEVNKLLKELRYKAYDISSDGRFQLAEITDIKKAKNKVIVCLHESFIPPVLPQPISKDWSKVVHDFFTR